jgi:hypothetical protein
VTRFHIAAAIALGMAAASGALADESSAPDTLTAESSAAAVSGTIRIAGESVTLAPQLEVKGSAPPAYDVTKSAKSYSKIVKLPFDTSLNVEVGTIADEAAAKSQQGGKVTATAGISINSASAKVTNPLVGGALLTVGATKIVLDASFTKSNTAPPFGSGTLSLTEAEVNLSAFGFGVITYSGTPRPNTVAFRSKDGTVVVYLNRQITTLGDAVSGNKLVPTGIRVDAIDVHLTDAQLLGETISGDLVIATGAAD